MYGFWKSVTAAQAKGERLGQAVYNVAYSQWPDVADSMRMTDFDCFYDDNRVAVFMEQLAKSIDDVDKQADFKLVDNGYEGVVRTATTVLWSCGHRHPVPAAALWCAGLRLDND